MRSVENKIRDAPSQPSHPGQLAIRARVIRACDRPHGLGRSLVNVGAGPSTLDNSSNHVRTRNLSVALLWEEVRVVPVTCQFRKYNYSYYPQL